MNDWHIWVVLLAVVGAWIHGSWIGYQAGWKAWRSRDNGEGSR